MMNSKENRRSFRIQETAYVHHEVIGEADFLAGIDRWRLRHGNGAGIRSKMMDLDARLEEQLFVLKTTNSKAAECLDLLRSKLDIVVDQLPIFRECKTSLAKGSPQVCDISADGMVFGARSALEPESKLALRLLLETDSRYIETFCRVVRVTDPPDADNKELPVGIAVEFVGMPPTQKEILIQHLFTRQSESLRIRRLELDAF
ncbi:MAG: PilZ domain-containing protein [Woeseia sp.]|nr:PilZ domain-containing protein [Woeseia sp.]